LSLDVELAFIHQVGANSIDLNLLIERVRYKVMLLPDPQKRIIIFLIV